jgi:hypothetical protein
VFGHKPVGLEKILVALFQVRSLGEKITDIVMETGNQMNGFRHGLALSWEFKIS